MSQNHGFIRFSAIRSKTPCPAAFLTERRPGPAFRKLGNSGEIFQARIYRNGLAGLQIADCGLWIVDCRLQIADCRLRIAGRGFGAMRPRTIRLAVWRIRDWLFSRDPKGSALDRRLQIADCGLFRRFDASEEERRTPDENRATLISAGSRMMALQA